MANPNRLPKAILEARGSTRAASRTDAPTRPGRPEPPAFLIDTARPYWEYILSQLHPAVPTAQDAAHIAITANTMELYHRLEIEAREAEPMIESHTGSMYPNPILGLLKSTRYALIQCLAKLGMNPSDRSNVAVQPEADKGKVGRFIGVA